MDDGKHHEGPPRVGGDGDHGFCTVYVHKWTKKRMVASEYGYKAWPFGPKRGG